MHGTYKQWLISVNDVKISGSDERCSNQLLNYGIIGAGDGEYVDCNDGNWTNCEP